VLPAVYFYIVLLILPVTVTFERGGAGIGRCFKLFHTNVGVGASRLCTVAGLALVVGIVSAVVGVIVAAADVGNATTTASAGPFAAASTTAVVVRTVVGGLLSALLRTFTSIMLLTAYADMRARVEPLSTAVLAAEIGIASPAAGAPVAAPA
jgi:hypothetical protein